MTKKNKNIILLCILLLLLSGCSYPQRQSIAGNGEETIYSSFIYGSYGENGVVYEENNIINYQDYVTGQSGALCSKPNCIHEPLSAVNANPYCEAALPDDALHQTFLYAGQIYTLMTDLFKTDIWVKKVYSEEWEKIMELPYSYLMGADMFINNGKIYYTAAVSEQEEGSPSVYMLPLVMEADLVDRTYRVLVEPEESMECCWVREVEGSMLYYEISKGDGTGQAENYLFSMDMDSLENSFLFETNSEYNFAGSGQNQIYTVGTAGFCRLEEGGWNCLYKDPAQKGIRCAKADEGLLLQVMKDTGDVYYFYDFRDEDLKEVPKLPDKSMIYYIRGENIIAFLEDNGIGTVSMKDYLAGKTEYTAIRHIN